MNAHDTIALCIKTVNDFIWGWPLIIFFTLSGIVVTIALKGVQFRYFLKSWSFILNPPKQRSGVTADMNPLQAFLNALSTSVGNGSLAGIAAAVHQGGPGAAFWIFALGLVSMSIRYAEVYLSSAFESAGSTITTGGPMAYLKQVPGGTFLPSFYAFFCLLLALSSGNAMQANSVSCGLQTIMAINKLLIATVLGAFVAYIMLGGAQRIVKFSEAIVPVKVGLFFLTAFVLLSYHITALPEAIKTIIIGAFSPHALWGGLVGITIQSAMRFGISRSANSTEIGLGTAAVFFGGSGGKDPVETGIMSLATAFISNYLVGFVVALLIVLTGVWTSPTTGITLFTEAYSTLYGPFAGYIVTALTVSFGIGVLVSYAYIGRECWLYLSGGRGEWLYALVYCLLTFGGALARVDLVWNAIDIVNAGLVCINLYGILYLLPKLREGIKRYSNNRSSSEQTDSRGSHFAVQSKNLEKNQFEQKKHINEKQI